MNFDGKKCLIAYYSRKGQNYVSGSIVDLSVGNTERVAGMIQEITDGDMFHIKAVKEYPVDYTRCTEVAQDELRQKARPELNDHMNHMENYDAVFLGYPNWWGTCPMPVFSFLEEYDFTGKTIIPFCTHEGSGMGHSENDISKVCKDATVKKGLAIHGTSASSAKQSVTKWIDKL